MTRISSLLRKSVSALLVAGALTTATVAGSTGAQAFPGPGFHPGFHHHWGHGWRPGLGVGLAAGLVGAAIASQSYGYCHWERRFDVYGDYIGRVRVCE
ncbi:MAG TPA: hypothetical protein VMU18_11355 [Rhodoblastus sp.]|nr:hypothetical protein [Rhodoblastus sp.]